MSTGGVKEAKRYCGEYQIRCQYEDQYDDYLCVFYRQSERRGRYKMGMVTSVNVGRPKASKLAADSAQAFDEAARAACNFMVDGDKIYDHELDYTTDGEIKISRRKEDMRGSSWAAKAR